MTKTRPYIIETTRTTIRSGFSGDDQITLLMPAVYGYTQGRTFKDFNIRTEYVGDYALSIKGILKTWTFPISKEGVIDWKVLIKIWDYFFRYELNSIGLDVKKTPLIFIMPPLLTEKDKRIVQEILFERFEIDSLILLNHSLSVLKSYNRVTGCIVSIHSYGYYVIPIYNNQIENNATVFVPLGGEDITHYLIHLLRLQNEEDPYFSNPNCFDEIEECKKRFCYIALNLEDEKKRFYNTPELTKTYTTASWKDISMDSKQFVAPELLFNPSLFSLALPSIEDSIVNSIGKYPETIKEDLLNNIILTGGSSLFPGLKERLQNSLNYRFNFPVKVIASPDRAYDAWIGASIFGSLEKSISSFQSHEKYIAEYPNRIDVSKDQYPGIIERYF